MKLSFLKRHLQTKDDFRLSKPEPKNPKEGLGKAAAMGGLAGAGVGAAIGAGVGYSKGLSALEDPDVVVKDETYFSQRPELVGAEYDDVDYTSRYNFSKEKWEHNIRQDDDWDPIIKGHDDKPHQRPEFVRSGPSLAGSVAAGALKGAAIGGVVGVTGAVAGRLTGLTPGNFSTPLEGRGSYLGVGAATGAVVGGIAGFYAGQVAHDNATVVSRTAPVYERQQIGWMPTERNASSIAKDLGKGSGDYELNYQELGDRYGVPAFQGQDAVHARVQVGEVSKEFRSNSLGPMTGMLAGVVTGSLVGVATGAAVAVLHELATG